MILSTTFLCRSFSEPTTLTCPAEIHPKDRAVNWEIDHQDGWLDRWKYTVRITISTIKNRKIINHDWQYTTIIIH